MRDSFSAYEPLFLGCGGDFNLPRADEFGDDNGSPGRPRVLEVVHVNLGSLPEVAGMLPAVLAPHSGDAKGVADENRGGAGASRLRSWRVNRFFGSAARHQDSAEENDEAAAIREFSNSIESQCGAGSAGFIQSELCHR
jgi:hypothetical protein